LRSVLGPAATGAIAIGTTATSTSTTTTTLTETPTETSTVVKLARATGGSITRNTGEMLPTGTGKRRISTAPMPVSSLGAELALALAAVPELEHVPVEAELEPAQVEAELERVPVEVAPVLVPVVAQPELVPVEVALGLVPVAAELQLAQVVVELELVPVAVALRTRSVTAVHHHGLVPLRAAEDLAAAAEITRDPAAPGEVVAWAVAGTAAAAEAMAAAVAVVIAAAAAVAAAAVVVAAAAVEVVAAAAGGRRNKIMISKISMMKRVKTLQIAPTIVVVTLAAAAFATAAGPKADASATPPSNQKEFASPKEAADALVQAAASFDQAALKEILGPESDNIVASEDPVQDKNRAVAFAEKAKEKTSLEQKGDHAIMEVGKDDFPLPIPIMKRKGKWVFDTNVGKEEILNRRIGANELNAIEICRGFVEAQHEYAQEKHDDSKVNQYAQRILSTPGKHDGLAWKNQDGTWEGPVGEDVAKALEEGYSAERGQAYHGYYFKVLKGQGPAAPMGQMDFVVGGAMIGGFALAAAPAEYRVTGVQTFMVGPDGVVYEKDLGPDTLKIFQSMDRYNPDKTWKVTDDDVEDDSSD
jgi:Protein of unknown function (DUF2950)